MTAVDTYVKDAGGSTSLAALVALLNHDDAAAEELVSRLTPTEVHLLEPAAERLSVLAFERRQGR